MILGSSLNLQACQKIKLELDIWEPQPSDSRLRNRIQNVTSKIRIQKDCVFCWSTHSLSLSPSLALLGSFWRNPASNVVLCPLGKPTWKGAEGTLQQPASKKLRPLTQQPMGNWIVLKVPWMTVKADSLPIKPGDDHNLSWMLDWSLVIDPSSESPS